MQRFPLNLKDPHSTSHLILGHTKAVTAVALHQNGPIAVSGSNDSTIRVWNYEDEEKVRSSKVTIHKDAVTSLSLHPTQDYILSSSNDKSWAFTDIFAERDIVRVYDEDRVTAAQFHPDGLILGTGTSRAEVKIWDLKSSSNVSFSKFSFCTKNFRRIKQSPPLRLSRVIPAQWRACAFQKTVIISLQPLATTKCESGTCESSNFSRRLRYRILSKSATLLSTSLELICLLLAEMSAFSKSKSGMR